jgi:hypothetical protein
MEEYPQDYFLKIENEPNFIGRVSLNKREADLFDVEVDVVHKESKKIFHHVVILYGLKDKNEAIDTGVFRLAKFLKQ